MRALNSILTIITLIILLGSTGCLHTYPSPEEPVDPTEIEMELVLHFNEEWTEKIFAEPSAAGRESGNGSSRAGGRPRRVYVEIKGSSGKRQSFTNVIYPEEIEEGTYRLQLPGKLKADTYRVSVWSDYLNPSTLEPSAYNISDPSLIKELLPRGEESDRRMCLAASEDIDLKSLSGKWNVKVEHEISLTTPMARYRLVADDYEEFLRYTEEARSKGERYYVNVKYESEIPGGFSLSANRAMDPLRGARFTGDLPILLFPGIEMSIASDWLFNPAEGYTHTLTVSVYNSAQALVSKTTGIPVPLERGHVTTVKGKLLTNFITGGIQIDNIWAGEIIIEI